MDGAACVFAGACAGGEGFDDVSMGKGGLAGLNVDYICLGKK